MPNKDTQKDVKKLSTQCSDNITDVYFRLDEPRVVACFRCNRKLWKTFKSTVKAQGLSICHVLETMILGWLQGYVYLSNTIKPIKIENLVVERAVKRVRRYGVEVSGVKCHFCGRDAVGWYKYKRSGVVVPLCDFHADEFHLDYEFVGWIDNE